MGVNERALTTNGCRWGGGRKEEKRTIQKMIEEKVGHRARFKSVKHK